MSTISDHFSQQTHHMQIKTILRSHSAEDIKFIVDALNHLMVEFVVPILEVKHPIISTIFNHLFLQIHLLVASLDISQQVIHELRIFYLIIISTTFRGYFLT